jgi:hypothetical protein
MAATSEKIVARPPRFHTQIIVDRDSCVIGQFEFDRSASFPLPNDCAIQGVAAWRNMSDLQGDNVATAKLAVDRQIEQRQITNPIAQTQMMFTSASRASVGGEGHRARTLTIAYLPESPRKQTW